MLDLPEMPWDSPERTHECPAKARHREVDMWREDSDGYGAAVEYVQFWAGHWWAHNKEYATEVSTAPGAAERSWREPLKVRSGEQRLTLSSRSCRSRDFGR